MPAIIYINNQFIEEADASISINNRSFKYGDGFFETIRLFENKCVFWEYHFKRIKKACVVLKLELEFRQKDLKEIIHQLCRHNNASNARVRLNFYRKGEGLYTPNGNKLGIIGNCYKLKSSNFKLNNRGLKIGIFDSIKKDYSTISAIKTNNALPYIMAAQFAKENDIDTAFLTNHNNNIVDSIYSNVWITKDGVITTPPPNDGGVEGTMQAFLLTKLSKWGINYSIESITEESLLNADEVFLTNAIKGIQWVEFYKNKRFKKQLIVKLINQLNNFLSRRY